MTDVAHIHDVSLRDGLQNLSRVLPTRAKLEMLRALIATGIRSFEVTSFVSPKAVPQLADAEDLVRALPASPGVSFEVLVPNLRGYARATAAGVRRIALVVAATDALNRANFGLSVEEGLRTALDVIARARADGVRARAYVAASMRCSFEGDVAPATVLRLAEALLQGGAEEIALADTIGGGGPAQAERLFPAAVATFGAGRLSAHLHDTRGLGSTLAFIALEAGIRRFDAAIGGLGGCPFAPGAAGNLATEDLVLLLQDAGFRTGVDLAAVMAAVDVAERLVEQPIGGRMRRWWAATSPERRFLLKPVSMPGTTV